MQDLELNATDIHGTTADFWGTSVWWLEETEQERPQGT